MNNQLTTGDKYSYYFQSFEEYQQVEDLNVFLEGPLE